jgi:hypothetical protein
MRALLNLIERCECNQSKIHGSTVCVAYNHRRRILEGSKNPRLYSLALCARAVLLISIFEFCMCEPSRLYSRIPIGNYLQEGTQLSVAFAKENFYRYLYMHSSA